MKIHLVLALLFTTALSEEKLKLDDIERENLRAESTSPLEQKPQSTYAVKSDDHEDYHPHHQHQSNDDDYQHGGGLGAFTTVAPSSTSHNNYHGAVYEQQDLANDVEYEEPQQIQVRPKSQNYQHQNQHLHHQLYYEPEVSIGNRYQILQQKTANEKYLSKNTVYIPMSQLLAYYSRLAVNQESPLKSELLHQLASQAAQQIPIPVYTPEHNPTPVFRSPKLSYQIQPQYIAYASKYPLHTQAIVTSKKGVGRLYSQASQTYNQPKDLLYTQAIVTQPQTQYLQQLIYPSSLYSQVNNVEPEYMPPQQTHSEEYTHYNQPERYQYIVDEQKSVHQNYEKRPEGINVDFVPPQLPPQRFKPDQYSIDGESEKLHYVQQHYITHTSQPKSLLDSYIPSHIIAAKDAERYREHPIKLESGFLPSTINFVHSFKKRKIN